MEDTTSRRSPKDAGRRIKKKPCALCKDRVEWVDYKDVNMLRKYMSDRGKIRARRVSGNCTQHQRDVAIAIKTARELVAVAVHPADDHRTTRRPRWPGPGRRRLRAVAPVATRSDGRRQLLPLPTRPAPRPGATCRGTAAVRRRVTRSTPDAAGEARPTEASSSAGDRGGES